LLAWALGEGLVGQVGFSSHGSNDLIAAALASERFGFCSLHLHLLDRQRLPLAQAALAAGLGVLAISPADKGGRLYAPPPQLVRLALAGPACKLPGNAWGRAAWPDTTKPMLPGRQTPKPIGAQPPG
jgi:predicted aldo/keto reductase-like oxidoreductase